MSGYNLPDDFNQADFDRYFGSSEDEEPRHLAGCICADCADAELTAEND